MGPSAKPICAAMPGSACSGFKSPDKRYKSACSFEVGSEVSKVGAVSRGILGISALEGAGRRSRRPRARRASTPYRRAAHPRAWSGFRRRPRPACACRRCPSLRRPSRARPRAGTTMKPDALPAVEQPIHVAARGLEESGHGGIRGNDRKEGRTRGRGLRRGSRARRPRAPTPSAYRIVWWKS